MDSQAVFGFDQLRRCSITDLSHGSWLDSSGLNNQPSTRSLGSSKRGILPLFSMLCKSSLHLLLVTLPGGGGVGLASTQMHAGIVFLFILSLPCRHVLFFFFPPHFPSAFYIQASTVCVCLCLCAQTLCNGVPLCTDCSSSALFYTVEKRLEQILMLL